MGRSKGFNPTCDIQPAEMQHLISTGFLNFKVNQKIGRVLRQPKGPESAFLAGDGLQWGSKGFQPAK